MRFLALLATFLALALSCASVTYSSPLGGRGENRNDGFAIDYGRSSEDINRPENFTEKGRASVGISLDEDKKSNSVPWGYGTTGSAYGSFGAATAFGIGIDGNIKEFQRSFALPNALQLNHLEAGSDLGTTGYGEVGLYNLGDRDNAYWLRARHMGRWDIFGEWSKFSHIDRPANDFTRRYQGEYGGLLRAFKNLRGKLKISSLDEEGTGGLGDRDTTDDEIFLEFHAINKHFDAILGASVGRFRDKADHENDVDRTQIDFQMYKELWPGAHLDVAFNHRDLTRLDDEQQVRETDVVATGMAYGPFSLPNLRLRAHARYYFRPTTFVQTNDIEEMLETGASFLYIVGKGTLSGGMDYRDHESKRLSRQGIENLLTTTSTPSASLDTYGINESPKLTTSWVRAKLDGGKQYCLSFKFENKTMSSPPQTAYVSGGSPSLYVNDQIATDAVLTLRPRSPVNLSITHREERRLMDSVERSSNGYNYRSQTHYLLNLGGLVDRLHCAVDATSLELTSPNVEVDTGLTDDLWAVGLHGNYTLSKTYNAFMNYTNIACQGNNESRERVTAFGIRYDPGVARALSFELAYSIDRFRDSADDGNSFDARTLTLSSESRF